MLIEGTDCMYCTYVLNHFDSYYTRALNIIYEVCIVLREKQRQRTEI